MRWNLRLAAANRSIWKASDMQRLLAEHGLVISSGKMSNLWSGQPVTIRLDDLDVICAVLGCDPGELLVPEPDKVHSPDQRHKQGDEAVNDQRSGTAKPLRPRPARGRSLPPG